MAKNVRWGILAMGAIAKKFAEGLRDARGAELVAVGSRSQEKADAFGKQFNVPRCHGSYEALAADADVDAIYVATPHPQHKSAAALCLEGGKAVLVEKPFTVNAREARELVALARAKKRFCMEAMWTRFIPAIARVRELIASGAIGEVRMVAADFGFRGGLNPEGRLFNPRLAGGGLLDVGVYCVSLASMILGTPVATTGAAHIGQTGVDEQAGMVLTYEGGKLAVLYTAIRTQTPVEASILGTDGRIRIHNPFFKASRLTITAGGKDETVEIPLRGNGYNYQAEHVGQCLRDGRTESDVMPLDESISILETLDALRAQWKLRYPME